MAGVPPSDQFVEVLQQIGTQWFEVGVFLRVSTEKLKEIRENFTTHGVITCLTELYDCLAKKGKFTWEDIATALRKLGNNNLAESIHSNYIQPAIRRASSNEDSTTRTSTADVPTSNSQVTQVITVDDKVVNEIGKEFQSLSDQFDYLTIKIRRSFIAAASNAIIDEMQLVVEDKCGLPPIPRSEATVEDVFNRLKKKCSILNFDPLVFAVNTLLSNEEKLKIELKNLKASVFSFNRSAKMVDLADLIKSHQPSVHDEHKVVKLKLQDFWNDFTMMQFEVIMEKILGKLYKVLFHITVDVGCICVSWIILPSVDYTKLLPKPSVEFLRIIGVISLHIGDDVIYNVGEKGCQTLEAAMLQAIELKNTRAIELLLAVGCNPEVATYNGIYAVTNVVNITKRSFNNGNEGGVDHVCILGHNEYVEANFSDDQIKTKVTELESKLRVAEWKVKTKDAVVKDLMKENEQLKKELILKEKKMKTEIRKFKKVFSLSEDCTSTVIKPRRRLIIEEESKIKVIIKNIDVNQLTNGGSAVRASLTCNKEECPVTDNGGGTYLVSVVPEQLGQHYLSITVSGQYIKNGPFTLNIVPQHNYAPQLKEPSQTITGIGYPRCIAFSGNGDMFVTSAAGNCVHVYNGSDGKRKTTVSSQNTGNLKLRAPWGIDISNDVVYVAEYGGHRIHMLTTGGEFIGTFGERGTGIGQFYHPRDVKISPDGRVYVADYDNNRVQVFNPNLTISHVIDSSSIPDGVDWSSYPTSIAFDESEHRSASDVHVTSSSAISVFTPNGQFVRQYGKLESKTPVGIAIDSSGYSFVTDSVNDNLSVYDSRGRLVHFTRGFNSPDGVSIAPDGSVWIADCKNCRLLKYLYL